jgi:hypothetical protein
MPPTNIRGTKVQVEGLTKLRATLRDLVQSVSSDTDLTAGMSEGERSTASRWAQERLSGYAAEAAQDIRDEARRRATAQNWPAAIIRAIFKYNDPDAPKRKNRTSAIVGIRKTKPTRSIGADVYDRRGVYVEWHAKAAMTKLTWTGKRKREKKIRGGTLHRVGKLLGMGLGTILERGTINATTFTRKPFPARPAFVPAVQARKGPAMEKLVEGYKAVIEEIVRRRATR